MTADDVLIDVGLELVRAFAGRPYFLAARPHPEHGLELEVRHHTERELKATAYLNVGEVLEFPHLGRVESAAGDVVAYIDALEGHPDAGRLGRIPNGRIPAFDQARIDGKTSTPSARRYRPGEVLE